MLWRACRSLRKGSVAWSKYVEPLLSERCLTIKIAVIVGSVIRRLVGDVVGNRTRYSRSVERSHSSIDVTMHM